MAVDVKQYLYSREADPVLDADFAEAKTFEKVKVGTQAVFWKAGRHWCAVPAAEIQRVFRRREPVIRRLCCGGKSYYIEWLVLVLQSGKELVIHIGDDVPKDAQSLLEAMQQMHPNLQYGKV